MNSLLAKIKNDLGNLTCPNCKKSAIISINGGKVRMNIDCPKEQDDFCYFFDQLDNKLRKHADNPAPKKRDNYFTPSSKFVKLPYNNPTISMLSDNSMSSEQISFYNYFKSEIKKGRKVEIYENTGYINLLVDEYLHALNNSTDSHFIRINREERGITPNGNSYKVTGGYDLILRNKNCKFSIDETIEKLKMLNEFYNDLDISNVIGNVYIFGDRYHDALKTYQINPSEIRTTLANKILNIKNQLGLKVSAPELFSITQNFTKLGLDNLNEILPIAELLLKKDSIKRGEDFLSFISKKYIERKKKYAFFGLSASGEAGRDLNEKFLKRYGTIKTYCYYAIPEFVEFCIELSRNSENKLREKMNLPKVGEGWISETELFYKIKNYLPAYEVIQHASPDWLGKQHLDIFIPCLNLAFEYHGKQHFEPVKLFGGQKGFENSQKRDKMKREKCKANRVMLIELKEGYDFNEIVKIIETFKTVFRN